jgi:RNA polymerase sigma-70 factor (family 1)
MVGLATGNKKAFEALYRSRWLPVFHFIKRFVIDQQAAEDITTDTFLKCWQQREGFEHLEKLDSFLFTVARHACLNYLRDEKRRSAKQKALLVTLEREEQPDLAEREVAVLVYQYIYAEIDKLPGNMQAVLRLHLEGVKNDAIAAQLGIAEKTVRNLKVEAIKTLRLRLSTTEFALLQLLLIGLRTALC